jgi:predicted amidohydrolase
MKVAAIHFCQTQNIDNNIERLYSLNIEASHNSAAIIVNPELSVFGKISDFHHAKELAIKFTDSILACFSDICHQFNNCIVLGILEKTNGYNLLYNTSLLIDKNGIILKYRKRFLTTDEAYVCQGYSELIPANTSSLKIGMTICADYTFPLVIRSLMLNNADMVAIPSHLFGNTVDTLRARAYENAIYLILANSFYESDINNNPYQSAISGFNGEVMAEYQGLEDRIIIADIDTSKQGYSDTKEKLLQSRRLSLYEGALQNKYQLRKLNEFTSDKEIIVCTISGFTESSDLDELKTLLKNYVYMDESLIKIFVFPELNCSRTIAMKYAEFFISMSCYFVCGYIEDNYQIIELFTEKDNYTYKKVHLSDNEKSCYKEDDKILVSFKSDFGIVSLLSGQDLLYPEVIEAHRNHGVDLIIASSNLDYDYSIIHNDIAQSRHINIAIAERNFNGGIYIRKAKEHNKESSNRGNINRIRHNITLGRSDAKFPIYGMEAIVRES